MRDGKYHDTGMLAAAVFDRNPKLSITDLPTQFERASVRRALTGLEDNGLVFRVGPQVDERQATRARGSHS
jgi:hypothetical protein